MPFVKSGGELDGHVKKAEPTNLKKYNSKNLITNYINMYQPRTKVPRMKISEKIAHRVVRKHMIRYGAMVKYEAEMFGYVGLPLLLLVAGKLL